MPILLIILGLLLILFGGGCTVIFIGVGAETDFLWLWLGLGVAPLVGGLLLVRYGLRLRRERRAQLTDGDKS
jgi:Flp pilus assembly protein TadB